MSEQGYPRDENGNMVIGSDNYTPFVGLWDYIPVSTANANLVLSKDQSQDVKKVYNYLKERNTDLICS